MAKTRSELNRNAPAVSKTEKKKEAASGSSKRFWKKRLEALCKRVAHLESRMLPKDWVDVSYDLFDACRMERSEMITRINWILHSKFNLPPSPSFHRSTQIEVALSLIE